MVKSAIELAMEKVAKMPKLDSEEIHEQKRKELVESGENLAKRVLNGSLRKKNLQGELSEFDEASLKIVRKSLIDCLRQNLSLDDPAINQLVLETVKSINKNLNIEEINEGLTELIDEYQQLKQMEFALVIKQERKHLEEVGITGNAIIPNVKTNPFWEQKELELAAQFKNQLEQIGKMITS